MTREEQIRQASIEYTMENVPMCIGGNAFSEVMDGMNRNHAFEEGAKWADEHPKNPWISVSDKLPFECEEAHLTEDLTKTVLVNICLCKKILAYMILINNMWVWQDTKGDPINTVTHWMPIPKITYENM